MLGLVAKKPSAAAGWWASGLFAPPFALAIEPCAKSTDEEAFSNMDASPPLPIDRTVWSSKKLCCCCRAPPKTLPADPAFVPAATAPPPRRLDTFVGSSQHSWSEPFGRYSVWTM